MEGFYTGHINPKATRVELFAIIEKETAFARDRDAMREGRIKFLEQRRDELLEANNRYLERARTAEALNNDHVHQLQEALDRIDFMQGEYDAAVTQHLEQDTWARMEIEKQKGFVSDWQNEALAWSKMFANIRQTAEENQRRIWAWVVELKQLSRGLLFFDIMIWVMGLLVIAGAVPPVFGDLPWWWK